MDVAFIFLVVVGGLLGLGGMIGAEYGYVTAVKPVTQSHWIKAEELCESNEGVGSVSVPDPEHKAARIDVTCANGATFKVGK